MGAHDERMGKNPMMFCKTNDDAEI